MESLKLTHGLLVENFKQSLGNLIMSNPLDIQTKAVVLDCFNFSIQQMAIQQTQKEMDEYQAEQARLEQENKNGDHERVSE